MHAWHLKCHNHGLWVLSERHEALPAGGESAAEVGEGQGPGSKATFLSWWGCRVAVASDRRAARRLELAFSGRTEGTLWSLDGVSEECLTGVPDFDRGIWRLDSSCFWTFIICNFIVFCHKFELKWVLHCKNNTVHAYFSHTHNSWRELCLDEHVEWGSDKPLPGFIAPPELAPPLSHYRENWNSSGPLISRTRNPEPRSCNIRRRYW